MVVSEMTIKQQWESLREKVLPEGGGFSKEQIHESRKMFFAGFASCFAVMDALGDAPDRVAVDVLNTLSIELNEAVEEFRKEATDASP